MKITLDVDTLMEDLKADIERQVTAILKTPIPSPSNTETAEEKWTRGVNALRGYLRENT